MQSLIANYRAQLCKLVGTENPAVAAVNFDFGFAIVKKLDFPPLVGKRDLHHHRAIPNGC